MAKKQMAKDDKPAAKAKAAKAAKPIVKSVSPPEAPKASKKTGRPAAVSGAGVAAAKRKTKAAAAPLPSVAAPVDAAKGKAKKAVKSVKATALGLLPSADSLPTPHLPEIDVKGTAREIGNQILAVLNTSAGRVIAAELLLYLATSLTKTAASTEAGQDVKDNVLSAGAKIGAAVASAGAKFVESGQQAAEAGVDAASGAALDAKGLVREVAQVAVSAVADTVGKVTRRRGKKADVGSDEPPAALPA